MKIKKYLAGFLSATAIFMSSAALITQVQADSPQIVRVGIYYSTNALPTANLANEIGSGYNLGYFNSNSVFTSLGNTSNEKISVLKDKNIYIGSDGLYYDVLTSSVKDTVGAYHLEVNSNFSSFDEAESYASSIDNSGTNAFVSYINGNYRVRIGDYSSSSEADSAKSSLSSVVNASLNTVGASTTCYTVTITGTDEILFEFDMSSETLGIMPISSSKAQTWFKGYKYYGGFDYQRQNGNDITVINIVEMEDYIKGVIPYEMSASWPLEALKAQALCARSYAYSSLGKHESDGFDVCTDVHCQVYRGTNTANSNSDRAVDETAGEYITHDGRIINAVFHSSDGGATEDSENVWTTELDYLRGVIDNFEDLENAHNGIWTETVTNAEVTKILQAKGYSIGDVVNMYVSEFTDLGNVYSLTVVDENGKKLVFSKESARTILNSTTYGVSVNSLRYNIGGEPGNGATDGNVPDVPETTPPSTSGNININGQASSSDSLFVAGANGTTSLGNVVGSYAITSGGVEKIEASSLNAQNSSNSDSVSTASSGTYLINGRGWGHNVGMSQYGARGMAEQGYSYDEIVKFYYTDVEISD